MRRTLARLAASVASVAGALRWALLVLGSGASMAAPPAPPATQALPASSTSWRVQLPPALGQKGEVIVLPRLQLDTPAASERANLTMQHLVLGALPPAARPGAGLPSGTVALPAGADIVGTTSLALARGGPSRVWQGRAITMSFQGEGCGAYCEDYAVHLAFDAREGRQLLAQALFTPAGLQAVTRRVDAAQASRLQTRLADLRRARQAQALGRDAADTIDAQLAMYTECLAQVPRSDQPLADRADPGTLRVADRQLVFSRGRCSNHAARGIDELGDFDHAIALTELAAHWSPYGRSIVLGEGTAEAPPVPAGLQAFRGRIDGRIAVTLFLRLAPLLPYDPPMAGTLYYDRVGSPIPLQFEPVPGQPDRWTMVEQTEVAQPGRMQVQFDRRTGQLVGDWRQAGGKPLAFEATALRGR